MNKFTTLATGITLAVASIGAFAQVTMAPTSRIDQREANQRARIDAGVASACASLASSRPNGSSSRERATARRSMVGSREIMGASSAEAEL